MKRLLHLRMEDGLVKQIDDYRFQNRFETRVAAIIDLLKKALAKR
jgi:hypothetical protein